MVNATGPERIRLLPPLTVSEAEIDDGWLGSAPALPQKRLACAQLIRGGRGCVRSLKA